MKIKFNDNLISIFNYIKSNEEIITYEDLMQFVTEYQIYEEYYLNYHIIKDFLIDHNQKIMKSRVI